MNRAEELHRAVRRAGLPSSWVVVFDTLVNRGDYATGRLPDDWQPRSIQELAEWCGLPQRTMMRALRGLADYGWIVRKPPGELRRGLATTYQAAEGRARRAAVGRPREGSEPLSDAERARRYRARKRGPQAPAEAPRHETVAPMSGDGERPAPADSVTAKVAAMITATSRDDFAGQPPDCAVGARREGVIEGTDRHETVAPMPDDALALEPFGGVDVAALMRELEPVGAGPCTRCGRPCIRYGPRGRPVCDVCAAAMERRAVGTAV